VRLFVHSFNNLFYLAEALHLASLLCYYGYFFHVTTNGAVQIKEDNELFRFQAPYFWVSTNWTTGNVEYGLLMIKFLFFVINEAFL
jgi:hypothetical protein